MKIKKKFPKRGDLEVIKTSEDNLVEGVQFHLYGTSLSGLAVDEYAVTDKNGVATFKDITFSFTLLSIITCEFYGDLMRVFGIGKT